MQTKLLTLDHVLDRLPYSKTEWYRGIAEGKFPQPLRRRPDKLNSRGVCWSENDINQVIRWVESGGEESPTFFRQ